MAFTLPSYNDRPLWRNPYILTGVGLGLASYGVKWYRSRPFDKGDTPYDPPSGQSTEEGQIGLATSTLSAKQFELFKAALPEPGKRYAELFAKAGAKRGVSPLLLAGLMKNETGYGTAKACLKSPACEGFSKRGGGDWGLMQINRKAHEEFWNKKVNGRPAYENPNAVIDYGALTLKKMQVDLVRLTKSKLSGNELLFASLAAYNAGQGKVARYVNAGKPPDRATYSGDYAKKAWTEANRILKAMNQQLVG